MNLSATIELYGFGEVPEIYAFIRKEGGKHCVRSHQSSRSFGCYKSKEQAKKRLQQISYFKHKG